MPVPPLHPHSSGEAVLAVARRAARVLSSRPGRRVVVGINVLVLLLAVAPFALWEGMGPSRFADVQLGQRPGATDLPPGPQASDPDAHPDAVEATATEAPWRAADLPFDLSPTTTVTLVFSVGSKGLADDEAERLRVHDVDDRGGDGLTDSMMLVVADRATREVALLSLPRDLWVHERGHRINATFNLAGLQALVDDVGRASGLPIHHLVRLNFGAFARLIDAVGGVPMYVDRPLADVPAVLYVPRRGCWLFDGAAALAWSRSRKTLTRTDAGGWVTDASASDFGRIDRQQALLGTLWDQIRSPGTIGALPELFGVARHGLVVDDDLGVQQVRDLLAVFGEVASGHVESYTLPTTGRWIRGAAAQVVVPHAATPILTRLRTWPPSSGGAAGAGATTPRPDRDDVVLAAPSTLALPSNPCTRDLAQALPDPRPPLGALVAWQEGRGPGPSGDERGEPVAPSEPTPSDDPSGRDGGPSPSPSPSDRDDNLLDLPVPGS